MIFLPISLAVFIILILFLPLIIILLQVGIVSFAFSKLGLTPAAGVMLFLLSLLGSAINIPVMRRKVIVEEDITSFNLFRSIFGIRIPHVTEQIIAVNVGGALIPTALALYVLPRAPFGATIIATLIVTIVAYFLSRPISGVGIALPAFIPPIVSALIAIAIAPENAPQVAYFSGVIGTLLGADILKLGKMKTLGPCFMSIGGAGVYDGIYLVGILSVILA